MKTLSIVKQYADGHSIEYQRLNESAANILVNNDQFKQIDDPIANKESIVDDIALEKQYGISYKSVFTFLYEKKFDNDPIPNDSVFSITLEDNVIKEYSIVIEGKKRTHDKGLIKGDWFGVLYAEWQQENIQH